jgi:hypothetical protein
MKFIKSLVTLSVVAALAGCSPEDQDVVDKDQVPVIANGAVIDPFISSAIVFADYNEDDVLDPFEPWAFTDKNGYYSVGKNGEDYCKEKTRYCLILPSSDPVKLVAAGGYDLTTLERVNSRMSRIYSGSGMQYITPLTSVGDMSLNEQNTIEKNQDIMVGAYASNDSAFGLAFAIHKIVELISDVVNDEYPAIGDDENLPVDATGFIYSAINKLGKEEQVSLTTFLTQLTDNQIEKILTDVRIKIDSFIIKKSSSNVGKSIGPQKVAQPTNANELGARIRGLNHSLNGLHNLLTTQLSQEFPLAKTRLLQIMANNANMLSASEAQATNDILETLTTDDAFFTKLAKDSFDASYFDNIRANSDIDAGTTRMENRVELPIDLTDMQLVLKDNSVKRDAIIGFFFEGKNNGEITACVKFQNLRKPNDSQNTNGTLLTGKWNKTGYSIDLTLTLAGTEEALRIKTTDNTSFKFDYDKTEKNWSTSTVFTASTSVVPTTDKLCQDWIASL